MPALMAATVLPFDDTHKSASHIGDHEPDDGPEVDRMIDIQMFESEQAAPALDSDASEVQAEVENEDDEGEQGEDDGEAVGPVKVPNGKLGSSPAAEAAEDENDDVVFRASVSSASVDEVVGKESSVEESDAEGEWEEASDGQDEEETVGILNPNRCMQV